MTIFEDSYFMNIAPFPAVGIGMGRLVARLDGETVRRIDPHIGFSHRGIEKCMEEATVLQGLVYTDKLNRSAPFSCAYAFVLAVEKLLGITVPERAAYIRVILAEMGRILSHLRATANLASETGTDIVYPLVNRASERISALISEICAGCPVSVYIRPGGVRNDSELETADHLFAWLSKELPPILSDIEGLLTENRIFKSRTVGIGHIDASLAAAAGFSGVNLRASGVKWDLRAAEPYDAYNEVSFDIPLKTDGDCYARYLLRIFEIYQSMSMIRQLLEKMPEGDVILADFTTRQTEVLTQLSRHFELYGRGIALPAGEVYSAVESPLGEFGVFLVSDGGERPYRCHFRSAGFPVMQALDALTEDCDLADVRVIVASLNIITTETDR
ncbi:MAG: NADH-quinone oxidoreductase subunit D [Alphaproteobacteria bacterium]|nr:NADH-quinone oxidoreductase subunit D [Alphaproteobacteria bacterium]